MAEEQSTAASTDAVETPEQATEDDYSAWEDQRRAELRGEEPQESPAESPQQTSEAPASEKEEPAKAESAAEAEPAETKQEQEVTDKPTGDKKPGKGGVQRRIDRLTRDKRELEQRVADLEGNAGGDKPAGADKPAGGEPPAESAESKPAEAKELEPGDFDNYEEFTKAHVAWMFDERDAKAAAAEAQKRTETAQAEIYRNWDERREAAREAHEDFDEVIHADIPITPAMQQAILEFQQGAELAYYLGSNPEEAKRITGLSPVAAVRELARIEATFGTGSETSDTKSVTDTTPPRKTVSKAPAPVRPVTGGKAGGPGSIHDPEPDFNVWEAKRRRQLKQAA